MQSVYANRSLFRGYKCIVHVNIRHTSFGKESECRRWFTQSACDVRYHFGTSHVTRRPPGHRLRQLEPLLNGVCAHVASLVEQEIVVHDTTMVELVFKCALGGRQSYLI